MDLLELYNVTETLTPLRFLGESFGRHHVVMVAFAGGEHVLYRAVLMCGESVKDDSDVCAVLVGTGVGCHAVTFFL